MFVFLQTIYCDFQKSVQRLCVGGAHDIPQSACQVYISSHFPSLVPFQMMKRVNILERNINSRHPEHSLVSKRRGGAICWFADESFRAETAARQIKCSRFLHQRDERALGILSLEQGMFEMSRSDTAVYSRQRDTRVIVKPAV